MIVFKVSQFPTYSETFIVHNIVGAIENGYDVRILADRKNPISNSSQKDLLEKYQIIEKVFTVKSIPTTRFRQIRNLLWDTIKNPFLIFLFFKYIFLKRKLSYYFLYLIKEYHLLFQAKVVHVHFCDQFRPIQDLFFLGLLRSKVVVSFHGYDVKLLSDQNKADVFVLNSFVSTFVANSKFTKENLVQLGIDLKKIQVVYNGIDVSKKAILNKQLDSSQIRILSVGRLVEVKGHIFALKAILELLKKGYRVLYTLVGEGSEFEDLLNFVKASKMETCVIFTGQATQREIFEYLSLNDIFLFPSTLDSTGRMEAFGIASLEAQLFGLPVIGFEIGGFPETIKDGETGYAVPDKDYIGMADKIRELVENRDIYSKMSQRAQIHVKENFNYQETYRELFRIYES
ncbi:glycosyltransferase [Algoriphagus formosus]|uniref:glycosyltransferase n=1 Tax=Algoriphagus formosus TaxID=2007308 RepID=UPI003F6EE96F